MLNSALLCRPQALSPGGNQGPNLFRGLSYLQGPWKLWLPAWSNLDLDLFISTWGYPKNFPSSHRPQLASDQTEPGIHVASLSGPEPPGIQTVGVRGGRPLYQALPAPGPAALSSPTASWALLVRSHLAGWSAGPAPLLSGWDDVAPGSAPCLEVTIFTAPRGGQESPKEEDLVGQGKSGGARGGLMS